MAYSPAFSPFGGYSVRYRPNYPTEGFLLIKGEYGSRHRRALIQVSQYRLRGRFIRMLSGHGVIKPVRHESKKPAMIPRWQRACPGGPRAHLGFAPAEPLAHSGLRDVQESQQCKQRLHKDTY